jgi:hypothetical protein
MSTRDRWTVYPLLLLAIGLAMRGQLVPHQAANEGTTLSADTVVCRELAILGESDTIIVHAGRVKGGGGGRIEVRDAAGVDAVAVGTTAESRDGAMEFFDERGRLIGRLGSAAGQPAAEQPPQAEPAARPE